MTAAEVAYDRENYKRKSVDLKAEIKEPPTERVRDSVLARNLWEITAKAIEDIRVL